MSTLRLDGLSKRFGMTTVVEGVSLEVPNGELLALLGRSGSGKTTLLRMIAGFETVDAGRIWIDGEDVTSLSALQRRCGMVFQHYALFPHLSVGENVAYGLATAGMTRPEREARTAEALAMVDLAGTEARSVTSLSGGQQQRVALARALAPRPRLLLLDEPLSNLDPTLREQTRGELRELISRVGITTILVTHEQEEAFELADRIAVLHQGQLQQVDAPRALYLSPATEFVAGFIGRATTLRGMAVRQTNGLLAVEASGLSWPVAMVAPVGSAVRLLVRPEALTFSPNGPIRGTIHRVRFAGAITYYLMALDGGAVIEVSGPGGMELGATVQLVLSGEGVHGFREPTR